MKLLKLLLASTAGALIVLAFRDPETGEWLRPGLATLPRDGGEALEQEPVLGYDGMDRDTLIAWLREADLAPATLRRIRRYEAAQEDRTPVLRALDELLG